jgi:hypothetical protein
VAYLSDGCCFHVAQHVTLCPAKSSAGRQAPWLILGDV